MSPKTLSRRVALLGAVSALAGCSAVSALNSAARPLATYDLSSRPGSQSGRRSARTMLVARPEASAAIATDRIMVKPDAVSITYLPDARWSDELPLVVQSLLVRAISGTGRIGYVGRAEGGPVPDSALLVRMDAFNVTVRPDGAVDLAVDVTLTLLNDRDQRVTATRRFSQTATVADDTAAVIVAGFQALLDDLLPAMADWAVQRG